MGITWRTLPETFRLTLLPYAASISVCFCGSSCVRMRCEENLCDEHECPLKCNSAFENLLHKANSKRQVHLGKQSTESLYRSEELFKKHHLPFSASSRQWWGQLKVDPCLSFHPHPLLCPLLEQQGRVTIMQKYYLFENDKCDIGRKFV